MTKNRAFPLDWPADQTRTGPYSRRYPNFSTSFGNARDALLNELKLMRVDASSVVISSNAPLRRDGFPMASARNDLDDPGVALYFVRNGDLICMACDRWRGVNNNLQAIRKSVEAIRGLERWGTGEVVDRAMAGFVALPAGIVQPWWEILDVERGVSYVAVQSAYRQALRENHPDSPRGDHDQFLKVQQAWEDAKREQGW